MINEIERGIRVLQKEEAEVRKERAGLFLKPCRGDAEIREKDEKLEELDRRKKKINGTVYDLQRKKHLILSEPVVNGSTIALPNFWGVDQNK